MFLTASGLVASGSIRMILFILTWGICNSILCSRLGNKWIARPSFFLLCLSVSQSVYLSVGLSVCVFSRLSTCLVACLSVCLSEGLSVCVFSRLSAFLVACFPLCVFWALELTEYIVTLCSLYFYVSLVTPHLVMHVLGYWSKVACTITENHQQAARKMQVLLRAWW